MLTYNVYNDIADLRNLVDSFFTDTHQRNTHGDYPAINVATTDEEIVIEAVIPGVTAEDITLNLVDNSLIIEGEKKEDYTDEKYIRKERHFGTFKRSVNLPFRVDNNSINAELKNGILTVSLLKSEDAKPKQIAIK